MDKLREECGIIAVSQKKGVSENDIAQMAFMGLISLQHRGQESAGIAVSKDGVITCYKEKGLVTEVFNEKILSLLSGEQCLGHVKYSRQREAFMVNAQPMVIKYKYGSLAVAFNGALVNGGALREKMEDEGVIFATQNTSEILAALIARHDRGDIAKAVAAAMAEIKGGYTFAVMTGDKIVGARDPFGIRPMALGKVDGGYALASESCAFDRMNGVFVRDVRPGEILVIENEQVTSFCQGKPEPLAGCIFEYIYFANPDSTIDAENVYMSRERAGYILAKEAPVVADVVIGVPDSGSPAALGFSKGSGIPFTLGLIKNKYVGRTFIQPTQSQREASVRMKLNPVRPLVEGKRIVLVDDSIVRGTTMRHLIASLRNAGAAEVHLRISSPPVLNSCYYGVDTPDKNDLIANVMSSAEICEMLNANSLAHISLEGVLASLDASVEKSRYCTGCFNGQYPPVE